MLKIHRLALLGYHSSHKITPKDVFLNSTTLILIDVPPRGLPFNYFIILEFLITVIFVL